MGKSVVIFICLFSLLGLTQASDEKPDFFVEGRVYCDPCRSIFKNNLMKPLKGAGVMVRCTNPKTKMVTYARPWQTNATGYYSVPVEGDHKNDICVIEMGEGDKDEDCSETPCEDHYYQTFRVVLTHTNETNGNVRKVKDFFYYTKKPSLKECIREFKNMKQVPEVQDIDCVSFFKY
ncbi:PREDICTED: olee1-like protein [Nicotiana attenuata]|uniref:Pollen-specific protein-like protein n=1 Tax=Nicotiana attenuata TaxID=49451 RepID=A0A314KH58_NICAT|nr:PREDICTED: olee1-like protein [Nicotiana attenuata]OIT28500.1 pollen-specific protein-like protein [Nicotiana attenuata]